MNKPGLFSSIVATERGHWSELSSAFHPGFTFELVVFCKGEPRSALTSMQDNERLMTGSEREAI